jgi:MoaA/NifB/PqqE/SkfB family radical SAM enzyme
MTSDNNKLPDFETIHVMPGLYCNFYCTHCVNDSGPKQSLKVSSDELLKIKESVSSHAPPNLQFTGGEPTFYSVEINSIIEAHPNIEKCQVQLTTNGWYASSKKGIEEKLGEFIKVDILLLSYDKFHSSKVTGIQIENLIQYCKENGIKFGISMCISDPKEMLEARAILSKYDADLIFQKVDSTGRAKKNKCAYKYPSFEPEVLEKKCPNLNTISYIAGKGFTNCCGNLIFNASNTKSYANDDIDEYTASDFKSKLAKKTFGELMDERGIDVNVLEPKHSSPCSLCEFIWEGQ